MKYIHNYERALASEARKRGVDGVICGHIHRPEVLQLDDVMYCNDGDWVESCTTLVEDHSGKLSLLRWTENREVILDANSSAPLIERLTGRSLDRAAVNSDASNQRIVIVTGCVATANQWCGAYTEYYAQYAGVTGARCACHRAQSVPQFSLPDLSRDSPVLAASKSITSQLHALKPNAVHIATEGPLGMAARSWCLKQRWPYTTSYHTQFPEYVRARFPLPIDWSYALLRRFHGRAARTMVATPSMQSQLESHWIHQHRALVTWCGCAIVQTARIHFRFAATHFCLCGSCCSEKNIEDFSN